MIAGLPLPTLLASESAVAILGLNAGALLLQMATFVIVFLILRKYAFGPIVATLEQRRLRIEEGLETADIMEKAKKELEITKEQVLTEARKSAAKIVADSKQEAADVLVEAEKKAREKADQLVARTQAQIADDVAKAQSELKRDLTKLVTQATEVVLRSKLDAKTDEQLVARATKEVSL